MVATVSRALAALVAVALLVVGAPLAPGGTALPASAARQAPLALAAAGGSDANADTDTDGSGPVQTLLSEGDSQAVAVAFPGWSSDHRVPVRDLPDGYSPVLPWVGSLEAPWARVTLPGSTEAPVAGEAFALPFGRAPPL
ncbi:hypothetical protein [Streptomonospora litoralis]|uniref:hypothetical protein n=1 Tax=Streptomonospora litoralis TaxID=2498135 RepID=UPI001035D292|nr:hypothetical protein [Streptomonospora litoralis]